MWSYRSYGVLMAVLGVSVACGNDTVSAPLGTESSLAREASASVSMEERAGTVRRIALRDDCDPRDPGWAPTGGCLLRRGSVNLAEFQAFLTSPLAVGLVGHPAWWIDPMYLKSEEGQTLLVRNDGGRAHTFTEVAQFGGGRVPPLNVGSIPVPECLLPPGGVDPTFVAPGGTLRVSNLSVGTHRFICCIHPWMRQVVKVAINDDRPTHEAH